MERPKRYKNWLDGGGKIPKTTKHNFWLRGRKGEDEVDSQVSIIDARGRAGPSHNYEEDESFGTTYPSVSTINPLDTSSSSEDENILGNISNFTNRYEDSNSCSEEDNPVDTSESRAEYQNFSSQLEKDDVSITTSDSTEEFQDLASPLVENVCMNTSVAAQDRGNICADSDGEDFTGEDHCSIDSNRTEAPENEWFSEDEGNQRNIDSESDEESDQGDFQRNDNNLRPLENLLEKPGFVNPVTTTVAASPGEILLNAMKFSFEHRLSQVGFTDLLRLINCIFAEPILPDSRYFMDKLFNSSDVKFHAMCPACDGYVGEFDRSKVTTLSCCYCKTEIFLNDPLFKNFFITLNPSSEIKQLLESNDEYYSFVVKDRVHENGIYKDIYDGKEYRKFVKSLDVNDRDSYATCSFNSDGSPVFKSSTFSIWPIQIMLNELPYDVRTNKPIVCGLWFGRSKPDMDVFLDPFVKMMNNISESGIPCQILNEEKRIKIFQILCCVDSVARAPMQGLVQFNGHYGCNWCLHPGAWVESAPGKGSTKYPLLDCLPENRTEFDSLKHMQESLQTNKPVYGWKNTTPLIYLLKFCIIIGFVPDYMHCLLLGVGKQFTYYFLKILDQSDIEKIDILLLKIKFPRAVSHLTRSLSDIKHWKAKDWENWILYSSIPVLASVLEKKKLLHWISFVEAFHLLLSSHISAADIERAQDLFADFVGKTEIYYSKSAMTYNVHQLLHLTQSVADWGPLWAHSGFAFESGNGQILNYIKCAKGVTSQISRAIALRKNEVLLKNHIFPRSCEKSINYYVYLDSKITKKTVKTSSIRYFGVPCVADEKWIQTLHLSIHTNVYKKLVKDKCLFQSSEKTNQRSNNSFAQTVDGKFIEILYFLSDQNSRTEYTICRILRTTSAFSNKLPTLRKVTEIDRRLVAVPTTKINKICVFMEVDKVQYISAVPHMYVY